MIRPLALLIAALLTLAGCGEDTLPTTLPGNPGEAAYVDSVELVFLESYPVQVRAIVGGNLPTPCHTVGRRVGEIGTGGRSVDYPFTI